MNLLASKIEKGQKTFAILSLFIQKYTSESKQNTIMIQNSNSDIANVEICVVDVNASFSMKNVLI